MSQNPVAEGETLTARVTVTTTAEEQPHGVGGELILSIVDGTAEATDYGSFSQSSFEIAAADFSSVTVNGAIHFQAVYAATMMIADDLDPEIDETLEIT